MRRTLVFLAVLAGALAFAGALTTRASATTFTSASGITINDRTFGSGAAKATPYPSTITVSGLSGIVSKVTVTISGLTHNLPEDIDMLLVSPSGTAVFIWGDIGGASFSASNFTVVLDDSAATLLPGSSPIVNGSTYQPRDDDTPQACPNVGGDTDSFPSPAPQAAGYPSALSALNGSDPNGTWKLFVVDDCTGNLVGSISSWSIDITVSPILVAPADLSLLSNPRPTFEWNAITQATSYRLEADNTGCQFPTPELSVSGLTSPTFTPTADLEDGTYCWRVIGFEGNAEKPPTAPFSFTIDATAPDLNVETTCDLPGNNNWCRADSYAYTMTASDTGSGLVSGSPVCTIDGAAGGCVGNVQLQGTHELAITATDKAGNTITESVTLGIDPQPPAITFDHQTPNANASGWNTTDVAVNWTCADSISGVVSPTVSQTVTGEGGDLTATGMCEDVAGNTSSNVQTIKIDRTAPTLVYDQSPPANADGWNNSDVTVTWTCVDGASGPMSQPPSQVIIGEGADLSSSASCTDFAGRSASATRTGIKIDRTVPEAAMTPVMANLIVAPANTPITGTADDGLSGVAAVEVTFMDELGNQTTRAATCSCAGNTTEWAVTTAELEPGLYTARARATDVAGNTGLESEPVTVIVLGLPL